MIAELITPSLLTIEDYIIKYETFVRKQPNYSEEAFRATCRIFMHVLMDKMYDTMEFDKMTSEEKMNMAERAGKDLSNFVYTYTNINTKKLYK